MLTGHIFHAFQLRRCAMASLGEVFAFISKNLKVDTPLPIQVIKELTVAFGILHLVCHDAGRPLSTVMYVSDASQPGYALHSTRVERTEVALWRRAVSGGGSRKPHRADRACLSTPRTRPTPPRTTSLPSSTCGWTPSSTRTRPTTSPLLRASDPEVALRVPSTRRATAPPSSPTPSRRSEDGDGLWWALGFTPTRSTTRGAAPRSSRSDEPRGAQARHSVTLSLGDNMSEITATEKGRAKNYELKCQCRRAAALQFCADILWRRRHVDTERNPSDWDSCLAGGSSDLEKC